MHFSLCIIVYLSFASSIIDNWSSFAVLSCIQLPSCNSALVPFLQVTLLIPWLNQEDQALVFHGKHLFDQPEQQTECIQDWIRKRTGFEAQFKIRYYPGRYDTRLLGIFPVGDLTVYIPVEEVSNVKCRAHAVTVYAVFIQFPQVPSNQKTWRAHLFTSLAAGKSLSSTSIFAIDINAVRTPYSWITPPHVPQFKGYACAAKLRESMLMSKLLCHPPHPGQHA